MNILSIETSCDETAVSVVEALGDFPHAKYAVRGNALFSQIDIHREYGGVFPNVAKREHVLTLVPMLEKALSDAHLPQTPHTSLYPEQKERLFELLRREEGLADNLLSFYERYNSPAVGLIAVTGGPGLEPALWVGLNFAKALSYLWSVPLISVNHMEGHILASIFNGHALPDLAFPALALLISGGHTELDLMHNWPAPHANSPYELLGQTRDDAVGEAFDKAARMMGLPYPGGPEISRLATAARDSGVSPSITLPRPMVDSDDLDFSFSGLKTAVRYAIEKAPKKNGAPDSDFIVELALAFENAVTDVLVKKTEKALMEKGAQSLILGGGVAANAHIRTTFKEYFSREFPDVTLYLPDTKLATDNAIMIAFAGHARMHEALRPDSAELADTKADGNRALSEQ